MGKKTWSPAQEKFLQAHYKGVSNKMLAITMQIPDTIVKGKAKRMGLRKHSREQNYRVLTDDEKETVRREYPAGDLKALAAKLGIKNITILYQKANALGLVRDPEIVLEQNKVLGKALSASDNGHRFKPGQTAYNKGKKQVEFMAPDAIERTKATRFKPDEKTHNRVPVGTERVDKDGYVQIKVRDMHGSKNYEFKHRVVWVEHNGPIPEGHIIEFIDGDRQNFSPDNLRCVTRRENVQRNGENFRALPADIKENVRLLSKLKKALQ